MSLILDALRKLDRERSFRRSGVRDIAVEIVRNDAGRKRRNVGYWLLGVLIVAVGISSFLVLKTGFFAKSGASVSVQNAAPPQTAAPSPSSESSAKTAPPPAAPVGDDRAVSPPPSTLRSSLPPPAPPAAVTAQKVEQKISPVPSARETPSKTAKERIVPPPPPPVRAEQKAPTPPQPSPARAEQKTPTPLQPEVKPAPRPATEAPPVLPYIPRPPAVAATPQKTAPTLPVKESAPSETRLKISGIVWHDDPSERKVVINGMVLGEGGSFEGMKVLEIYPDRVRLLRDGKPFELTIFP